MDEDENKGFLSNIFERITGAFSLIQLKQNNNDNIEYFKFTQIESKLQKIHSPAQQINFLISTQHEFNIVLSTLKESVYRFLTKET